MGNHFCFPQAKDGNVACRPNRRHFHHRANPSPLHNNTTAHTNAHTDVRATKVVVWCGVQLCSTLKLNKAAEERRTVTSRHGHDATAATLVATSVTAPHTFLIRGSWEAKELGVALHTPAFYVSVRAYCNSS